MTLYEFNDLDQAGKSLLLANRGVIIGERNETATTYTLFHMGSFYAEVCYDVEQSKLLKIRSFVNTGPLNEYLTDIDITEVWKEKPQ